MVWLRASERCMMRSLETNQTEEKMRKLILVCGFSFLSAAGALAQGRVAVQWNCAQAAPVNSLDAGDQPNHVFSISQAKCTATKGEVAGVKQHEGVGTEFHEVTGTSDRFHGVYVETLANGDKITYTYKGTATVKAAGGLESANHTWSATSGTGKFKGIKASGSCKGVGKADGTSTFDCSGNYSIPK